MKSTSQKLADVFIQTIKNCRIDLNFLCELGYDGASSMSGQCKGVQTLITNEKYLIAVEVVSIGNWYYRKNV